MDVVEDVRALRRFLDEWIESCDHEMRAMVRYQLTDRSKLFRPVTVFACHRAVSGEPMGHLLPVCAAVELLHQYATVMDDIIDRDRYRRGKLALHHRFGTLPALMTGAYLSFSAAGFVAEDPYATRVFAALGKRVAAVECQQWRLRRQPFGIAVWRGIAGEDTGAMFESAARVATRDERLVRYAHLLGIVYHGCDDIADLRGTLALGAHSDQDVRDRILTLPAAIALRAPDTARLFAESGPDADDELLTRLKAALPQAEKILDGIASEAEVEARQNAPKPKGLVRLVEFTRELSNA